MTKAFGDLAELVGSAIALQLLCGIPLAVGDATSSLSAFGDRSNPSHHW